MLDCQDNTVQIEKKYTSYQSLQEIAFWMLGEFFEYISFLIEFLLKIKNSMIALTSDNAMD